MTDFQKEPRLNWQFRKYNCNLGFGGLRRWTCDHLVQQITALVDLLLSGCQIGNRTTLNLETGCCIYYKT